MPIRVTTSATKRNPIGQVSATFAVRLLSFRLVECVDLVLLVKLKLQTEIGKREGINHEL